MSTKNEFIIFLQDEIAELKAQLRDEKPERIRKEVDFKSVRGYKSVHTRIRDQVLAQRKKFEVTPEESNYEVIND
jgi:hypothetical protein